MIILRRFDIRTILALLLATALPLIPAEAALAQSGTGAATADERTVGSTGTRGSGVRIEQGVSAGAESGSGALPDPRECSRCYEVFEKQNRDCRGMQNEVDRDVCLDAVRDAYRRCSKNC